MGGKDSNQLSKCPCGLSVEVCELKHTTLDKDITFVKEEQVRLRVECRNDIKESECRASDKVDISESHMIERLGFQKDIVKEITDNMKASYKEGLQKVVDGLNVQRKDIEDLESATDILIKELPTNAISRFVKLEKWIDKFPENLIDDVKSLNKWKWILTGIGTLQGALFVVLWWYYNSIINKAEAIINRMGG